MNFVRATAIVVFIAIGSTLMVANAEAQLPSAATPQPTPAALLNPNWCSDVPASPPPPNFDYRPGEWAYVRKMCMAKMSDLSCGGFCRNAEDRWRQQKAGLLNHPNALPSPTDKLQGPFPLPGGASGYILPAQPAPTGAASGVAGPQSSVLSPGPFSMYPGQELNGQAFEPPDVSADVSPTQNVEFVNALGLYVWAKPALPVQTPMAAPTPVISDDNFWCNTPGVNGQRLPGCDAGGSETLGTLTDTQIGYDATLGRWIATQFAANGAIPTPSKITSAVENGTTATITTTLNPYGLVVGDIVTIAGVTVAGYNGNFVVTAIPSPGSTFQYTTTSGLAASSGGTAQLPSVATITSASEVNFTVTVTTTANPGLVVGAIVTIAGVNVAGYNGNFPVTAIPSGTTFQYTTISGLGSGSGGTAQLVPDIGYLYFAASTTGTANMNWNKWSVQACTTDPMFPAMDQPLLGWSGPDTNGNSSVAVDVKCAKTDGTSGPDNVFLIPSSTITSVSQALPAAKSAPCAFMAPARDEQGSSANAYLLASIVPGSSIQANAPNCAPTSSNTEAYAVEYTASTSGIFGSSGCTAGTTGCTPASIGPQYGNSSPVFDLSLADQSGCNAFACMIDLRGEGRITAAQIRPTNISGVVSPVLSFGFATGVNAGASGPQSQNLWFLQNVSSGNWLALLQFAGGSQWYAYPTIAMDGDAEFYLGSTQFTSTSFPSTIWDAFALTPGPTFMGQNFIEQSTGEYLGNPGQQPAQQPRWGDYNTMIYDSDAIGLGGDGSWWSVEEVTCPDASNCDNGTSDESTSWVALADPSPLPYFVGYSVPVSTENGNVGEDECINGSGFNCNLAYTAPAGSQFGDLFVATIYIGEATDASHLTLPTGWTALKDQFGTRGLISSDSIGSDTSFVALYVYGSQPNDTGTYKLKIDPKTNGPEVIGFMVAYRGASANIPGNYVLNGNPGTASGNVVVTNKLSPNNSNSPAGESRLLYLFDEDCLTSGAEDPDAYPSFSSPSGPSHKLTSETPFTSRSGIFAADVGVRTSGGTYGPYNEGLNCQSLSFSYSLVIPEK